jgi:C2 domain of PTEN tumour-suppressor protein
MYQLSFNTNKQNTNKTILAASVSDIDITGERKLAAIGHLLNRRHDGRYMVWNISEVPYDVDILDDQVLTFSFPGSPSPPLGLLLKLLVSMESWLKADPRNVAVVHCLTGKGRTSTVLAAFLCWMGEAGFSDINQALDYIAKCKQITPDELTIPSQRRYCSYFKNMLDGVHPSQPPMMLRRIIMSEAPTYAKGPTTKKNPISVGDSESVEQQSTTSTDDNDEEVIRRSMGCVPYIQLFKAGKLLHTAPATLNYQENDDELPFCTVADGSISFHINQIVQGDILIRARHLTATRKRISMFRAAFHTGYVPPKVMRLTKTQLDGACIDERFPSDFFLDLIFEPVDAEEASKLLNSNPDVAATTNNTDVGYTTPAVDIKPGSAAAAELMGGGNLVTASAYDTMLHRDSRFWDVIAARKRLHDENQEQYQLQQQHSADGTAINATDDGGAIAAVAIDPMVGPIIGRRRAFDGTTVASPEVAAKADAAKGALETFSIGGEFDFLPEVVHGEAQGDNQRPTITTTTMASLGNSNSVNAIAATGPPKKDHLMEALMGALEDDDMQMTPDHEVVIFDSHPEGKAFMPMAPILPLSNTSTSSSIDVPSSEADARPKAAEANTAATNTPTVFPSDNEQQQLHASVAAESIDQKNVPSNKQPDDVDALNAALLDVDNDLAGAGAGATDDDDVDDVDYLNLDIDDAELEDLENFLSKT